MTVEADAFEARNLAGLFRGPPHGNQILLELWRTSDWWAMPINLNSKEFSVMPKPKGWRALVSWRWRLRMALKVECLAIVFSEWLAPELKEVRE